MAAMATIGTETPAADVAAIQSAGPRLPIEVIESIIDAVSGMIYHYNVYIQDQYRIWRTCALVCRAMTPRSQYWLFRRIVLESTHQVSHFMEIARRNPKVCEYTQELIIGIYTDEQPSWVSNIPILLAPRMINLTTLWLEGDLLSGSHAIFTQALTAFKRLRRLELYQNYFFSFGHCARFIHAFPNLDHLGFKFLTWKEERSTDLQHPTSTHKFRVIKSRINHLDLWSNVNSGPDLQAFMEWFSSVQEYGKLRTLSLHVTDNDHTVEVLRFAPNVLTLFLMVSRDTPIDGFANLTALRVLHIEVDKSKGVFALQAISSIVLSLASKKLEHLVIYIEADEWARVPPEDENVAEADPETYKALDNALSSMALYLTVCLYAAGSAEFMSLWRRKLPSMFPLFCAKEKFKVECTASKYPHMRWLPYRDGYLD